MDASNVVAVIVCLLVILVFKKLFTAGRNPPGPWGLPVLGYLPFLSAKPHLDIQRLAKKYGNVFCISMGSKRVLVLNDFQSTKEAFVQDAFMGKPPDFSFDVSKENFETGAGFGLPWKEQRRFCLHTLRDLGFGKSKMEERMQEDITELLAHLEKNVDEPYSARGILSSSMANNMASLMFGKRFKYDDPVRQMLAKAINEGVAAAGQVSWTLFFPWLKNILKFLGTGDLDRVSRLWEGLRSYVWKEIEEHDRTLNCDNIRDFIDGYLIEIKNRKDEPAFCKPVLQDLVVAFFAAGSETVRVSLEWLLLIVSTHTDSQHYIQSEIDDVIGQDRLPIWMDHKKMPYTEAFIMEMMRWRTIVPLNLLRYTLFDSELNGFFIPKSTHVLANLWAIHHDPETWGNDAEEFRPERFLTEDGKALKKMDQYIPFSIGKRACPGEPLAKIETFLYFVAILQKFKVRLPEGKVADLEGDLGLSLVPKPQDIIFTKRS